MAIVEVDGVDSRIILADSANRRCPTWAPDGRRFVVSANSPSHSDLIEASIQGGATKLLLTSATPPFRLIPSGHPTAGQSFIPWDTVDSRISPAARSRDPDGSAYPSISQPELHGAWPAGTGMNN